MPVIQGHSSRKDLRSQPSPSPSRLAQSGGSIEEEAEEVPFGSAGVAVSVTLLTCSQSLSMLKDAIVSFVGSLPRSCLHFLAVSVAASVANCTHGLVVLVVGTKCSDEQAVRDNYVYYGLSQLMLGLLITLFAVHSLVRENFVEILAAIVLVLITCFFDVSLLYSTVDGDSLLRSNNGTDDKSGCDAFADAGLRVPFLVLLVTLLAAMVYWGKEARMEFGWRIFKMCQGSSLVQKQMFETLFTLRAWVQLDCALTLQMLIAGSTYLLSSYSDNTGEITMTIFSVFLSLGWLVGAFVAMHFKWKHYWWKGAFVAFLQPAYFMFKIPEIFTYEMCRRGKIDCSDLTMNTDQDRWKDVWELPVYFPAQFSIIARVVTFAMLHRVSVGVWNNSEIKLQDPNAKWKVPRDMASQIDLQTSKQVEGMVNGAQLRVLVVGPDPSGGQAADASAAGRGSLDGIEPQPKPVLSAWRGWFRSGLGASTTKLVSQQRFVQMSTDLSTLRWSWSDYILLHEIDRVEGNPQLLTLRVHHGPVVNNSRKQLELGFDDEPSYSSWYTGLRALKAALSDGGDGVSDEKKLEWLLQIFRLADTANLGSVTLPQLRDVMNYLHCELPDRFNHGSGGGRGSVALEDGGPGGKPRLSLSARLNLILAPPPKLTLEKTFHFREFQRIIQKRALIPAVPGLLKLVPSPHTVSVLTGSHVSGHGGSGSSRASAFMSGVRRFSSGLTRTSSGVERGRGIISSLLGGCGYSGASSLNSSVRDRGLSASPDKPTGAGADKHVSAASLESSACSALDASTCSTAFGPTLATAESLASTITESSRTARTETLAPGREKSRDTKGGKDDEEVVTANRTFSLRPRGLSLSFRPGKRVLQTRRGKQSITGAHAEASRAHAEPSTVEMSQPAGPSSPRGKSRGIKRAGGGSDLNRAGVEQLRTLWRHPQMQGPHEEPSEELLSLFRRISAKRVEGSRFLSAHGLQRLLLSDENELFDPRRKARVKEEDMIHPLTDYFIASSHNSYLVGDQWKSNSDCRMYEQQLLIGCRCLEIDCWDGADGEPMVYHGMTLTSKIKFRDVIASIKNYAFVTSAYPVILSFEMHCSLPQQEKIANYLESILGTMLHRPDDATFPTRGIDVLPSPKQLEYKVLVKGRTLDDEQLQMGGGDLNDDMMVDEEDAEPEWTRMESASATPREDSQKTGAPSAAAAAAAVSSTEESAADGLSRVSTTSRRSLDEPSTSSRPSPRGDGADADAAPHPTMADVAAAAVAAVAAEKSPAAGAGALSSLEEESTTSRRSTDMSFRPGDDAGTLNRTSERSRGADMLRDAVQRSKQRKATTFHMAKTLELGPADKLAGPPGGPKQANKKPVHPKLSDCTAISGRKFKKFAAEGEGVCWQMSSFGENKASKLIEAQAHEWVVHNTQQLSRSYPKGTRVDSSNYDAAVPLWNVGVHMVALNYQTPDLWMQLERAKFADNGGCGYVLKPDYLRRRQPKDEPPKERGDEASCDGLGAVVAAAAVPTATLAPATTVPPVLHVLRLEVLGALHVPTVGEVRSDAQAAGYEWTWWSTAHQSSAIVCDPFVSVEAFSGGFAGAAERREDAQHRSAWCSTEARRNGLNPTWDGEAAEVVVSHPEIAQLYISLCHRLKGKKTQQLCAAVLPMAALRQGVRCVTMADEHGAPILFCKMLVRASWSTVKKEQISALYYQSTAGGAGAGGKGGGGGGGSVAARADREPSRRPGLGGGAGGRGSIGNDMQQPRGRIAGAVERARRAARRTSVFRGSGGEGFSDRRGSVKPSRRSMRGSLSSSHSAAIAASNRGSVQSVTTPGRYVAQSQRGSCPTASVASMRLDRADSSSPGPPPPLPPGVSSTMGGRGSLAPGPPPPLPSSPSIGAAGGAGAGAGGGSTWHGSDDVITTSGASGSAPDPSETPPRPALAALNTLAEIREEDTLSARSTPRCQAVSPSPVVQPDVSLSTRTSCDAP